MGGAALIAAAKYDIVCACVWRGDCRYGCVCVCVCVCVWGGGGGMIVWVGVGGEEGTVWGGQP